MPTNLEPYVQKFAFAFFFSISYFLFSNQNNWIEWSLNRWNTPYLPVVICPNAAFCYQRSKHKNIRPRRYDMFLAHTQHWIHLLCDAMLSSAMILRKTVVSHWLKIPVCSSWKFIAAHSNFKMANCCRVVCIFCTKNSLINFKNLSSKNIFRTAFCAVKFLTFFETTSFYIFCTLTGDNDQYPSLNIWLQPEYFTAENWKTAHWVCKHNKLLR